MSELLEKYIDYTFDKNSIKVNSLTSYIVEIVFANGDKMSLMNLGNDILVYIDNELYETVSYKFNHVSKQYDWIIMG